MSDLNRVSLIGRLARDADVKYAQSGTAIVNLSIAVGKSIPPKQDGGEWGHKTSFIDITWFGQTAEKKAPNMTKGRQIAVDGELQQDQWEYEGKTYNKIKVLASSIQLLALPRGKSETGGDPAREGAAPAQGADHFEDDIPF